jgi:hypothetical protein
VGGDLLNPHYSWDHYENKKKGKKWSSGPKKKEGLHFKEIPMRNTSAGGWKPLVHC